MSESAAPSLSHPTYRPDIDGLRAIAVLSVVTYHAFPNFIPGGFIGVDVFFVISGFLISTIIFGSLQNGSFQFSEFYARRILRIFPALTLVLLSSLVIGWNVLVAEEMNQLGKHVLSGASFVSNWVLWGESGYFDNAAETKPLLHLWSLGIEEQFYIFWPLVLWLAWKAKSSLWAVTLIAAVVSFYLNIRGISRDSVTTFFLPQTRVWELLVGGGLAWVALNIKNPFPRWSRKANWERHKLIESPSHDRYSHFVANTASLLGASLFAYGFWAISKNTPFPGKWALLPVLGTCLMIGAGPQSWLNKHLLSHKLLVWFGLISFPLYLWHWPLMAFARIIENETPPAVVQWGCVLASVVLAWITVRFVEKPFRSRGPAQKVRVALLTGAMTVTALLGLMAFKADLSSSHGYEKSLVPRKGFEHAFGASLTWIRGKDDWLFLGNAHDQTVAKLRGSIVPTPAQVHEFRGQLEKISQAASDHNTQIALLVGPNKSTVYPEYLPDELQPAAKRYVSDYLGVIRDIPRLTVHDPLAELLGAKTEATPLYFRVDTHWNQKGAYIAYTGLLRKLDIPAPMVHFVPGGLTSGDIVGIAKLQSFPLRKGDNFDFSFPTEAKIREVARSDVQHGSFGAASVYLNDAPTSDKTVWVVGDSFSAALRPYLNATFKEVHYIGHWSQMRNELPHKLADAPQKPDLIIVVQVERTF